MFIWHTELNHAQSKPCQTVPTSHPATKFSGNHLQTNRSLTFLPYEFLHLKKLGGLKCFKTNLHRATDFHTISYAALPTNDIMFENPWNNDLIYSVYRNVVLLQYLWNNINYGLIYFTSKSLAAKTITLRYYSITKMHYCALNCRVVTAALQ